MKTSNAGRSAIRLREGCKLSAYKDVVGVWTIGVGHTGRASAPPVTLGMKINLEQADQFLSNDLVPFEKVVNACGEMSQNQFDACVSLAFNIGENGFKNSTVARRLKEGDYEAAGKAILMWNKPPAIIGRRQTEYHQFFAKDSAIEVTVKPVPTKPITTTIPIVNPQTKGFWARLFEALARIFKAKK